MGNRYRRAARRATKARKPGFIRPMPSRAMDIDRSQLYDRIISAAGALAIQALLAWLLIIGLAVTAPGAVRDELKLFAIGPAPPPPPPEKIVPRPAEHHLAKGADRDADQVRHPLGLPED